MEATGGIGPGDCAPGSAKLSSSQACLTLSAEEHSASPVNRMTPARSENNVVDTAPTLAGEVQRYLLTGESDPYHRAWPGGFLEKAILARNDLRAALVHEVKRRTEGRAHEPLPETDMVSLVRAKVQPMVQGLFPRAEQEPVLAMLERSVVFLTSANIEAVLLGCSFDHSAWTLANLYLASLGVELLGENAPHLVGLSEETTCYISPEYFVQSDPFADFVVHEAAHIFHNCKRATVGLRQTLTREWLLDIDYLKRETFAYACEAYARVLEKAKSRSVRRALADSYSQCGEHIGDERVDAGEVASIVREAAESRNGWKLILANCAPPRRAGARSRAG